MITEILDDCYLVGANPSFDAKFITAWLRKFKAQASWKHRMIDVEILDMQRESLTTPRGLQAIAKTWSIQDDANAHTAIGDAETTMHIFSLLTGIGMGEAVEDPDSSDSIECLGYSVSTLSNHSFEDFVETHLDGDFLLAESEGKELLETGNNYNKELNPEYRLDYNVLDTEVFAIQFERFCQKYSDEIEQAKKKHER